MCCSLSRHPPGHHSDRLTTIQVAHLGMLRRQLRYPSERHPKQFQLRRGTLRDGPVDSPTSSRALGPLSRTHNERVRFGGPSGSSILHCELQ
jgi:hypothetical protein